MTLTITAFERSPDGGKGLARDTRVPGRSNLPLVEDRVRNRLKQLSVRLADADLAAYVARGEARPAYRRAFDAHRAVYT